jgi:hypothetical protein
MLEQLEDRCLLSYTLVQSEASIPGMTTVMASSADDTIFAAWDDPLLDSSAANGLTQM